MNSFCIVFWLSVNGRILYIIYSYYTAISATGVILLLCGQPTLEPLSLYVCPNETAVFSCRDRQVRKIVWIAEPYIAKESPLVCVRNVYDGIELPIECYKPDEDDDHYSASITNITNINISGNSADMTAIITIHDITLLRKQLKGSIVIICRTNSNTSASLTLAGLK